MIFINNKYTAWYNSLINKAQNRTIGGYTEKHHIIPSSLGGTNDNDNLVKLTAREHFVCHLLLTKMTTGNAKYKMNFALHMLSNAKNIGEGRYIPKGRMYDLARRLYKEALDNYWTDENRTKQSKKISSIMRNKMDSMTVNERLIWVRNTICKPESYTPERIEKARLNSLGKKKTKTPKLIEAEKQRKIRVQSDPLKCGDSNRGKTWKLIEGKRVWFTKEK